MLKNFILVALGGCAGSISLDTFYVLITAAWLGFIIAGGK